VSKVTITIDTDNAAFSEPDANSRQTDLELLKMEEVGCILGRIAAEIFIGNDDPAVQDRNGNTVGSIVWKK
jgi:hypothetical protein